MTEELLDKKKEQKWNDFSDRPPSSPRKLRWSTCVSFVSNQWKRMSRSNLSGREETFRSYPSASVQNTEREAAEAKPWSPPVWEQPSSLLPPPRQAKAKRESVPAMRSEPGPSHLRLSLDGESLAEEGRPTPIRSGTLGGLKAGQEQVPPSFGWVQDSRLPLKERRQPPSFPNLTLPTPTEPSPQAYRPETPPHVHPTGFPPTALTISVPSTPNSMHSILNIQ
ncbi:hypothetical protein BY458DRAFT_211742 [Sporodiniella umbellata]|nr:hypothetical protein BY458DRAFT_211742 [Sporodiniella umbellata]